LFRALLIGAASILLAILGAGTAMGESPVGDWTGRLAPDNHRISVHIRAASPGAFAGTVDIPDHDRMGAQLSEIAPAGDALTFVLAGCGCRFAGKWDSETRRWIGTWFQGSASIPLELSRGQFPPDPIVTGLDGDWRGTVGSPGGQGSPLVLQIRTYPDGTRGHLEFLDRYDGRMPLSSITRHANRVVLQFKSDQERFEGSLSDDGKTLAGTWADGGRPSPLTLTWRKPTALPSASRAASVPLPIATPPRGAALPSDAEIRQILRQRIDVQRQSVGIVVGVIDRTGRRTISYGALNQGDRRPLNGDTVFEIGSITKVFTSLLLAQAVQRGEVALDDPVAKYLPPNVKVPERGGKRITLVDLAMHTSGLPREMSGKPSVRQLYGFLGGYNLTRDIGSQYEYSNLGMELLGHALARRAGVDYATLVRRRILEPLGMPSTAIRLSPGLKARLAMGHAPDLRAVANWDLSALPGAGALRSTTSDLLTFLAAELGDRDTPLKAAMAAQLSSRRPTGTPGADVALGWNVSSGPLGEFFWHDGATGGYRTFVGFDPKARIGVVILSNAGTEQGVNDIGFHMLQPARPLLVASPP
jgi:serine-type D-Ala-D-Ala carboxypeptidase/endopeptidase